MKAHIYTLPGQGSYTPGEFVTLVSDRDPEARISAFIFEIMGNKFYKVLVEGKLDQRHFSIEKRK